MYNVTLILQVHACCSSLSSEDVWMSRSFKLPFAPYPGLRLVRCGFDVHIDSETEIYWDVETERFRVYFENKTLYNTGKMFVDKEKLNEIVKGHIDDGWQLRRESDD